MSYSYKPKPCRRCGGDKFADGNSGHPWYCAPCAIEARRDFYLKEFPWWCKQCDSPHYCVTCQRIKRELVHKFCDEKRHEHTVIANVLRSEGIAGESAGTQRAKP